MAAILASLMAGCFAAPLTAEAAETVSGGGRNMFEVDFLDAERANQGGAVAKFLTIKPFDGVSGDAFDLTGLKKDAVLEGVQYWADILGAGAKNETPMQLLVAGQTSKGSAWAIEAALADGLLVKDYRWPQAIQSGDRLTHLDDPLALTMSGDTWMNPDGTKTDNAAFGAIVVGKRGGADREGAEDGWWVDAETVLPTNEQAMDLAAVARHELAHALGVYANETALQDNKGISRTDDDMLTLFAFSSQAAGKHTWLSCLVDQNLNPAAPGKAVISSQEFARRKAAEPSLAESDFFILDAKKTDNTRSGKAYFVGEAVREVLDGAKFDGVSGLPVLGWEDSGLGTKLDLAHIEIGGLMSHANYRNYTTFIEAELAVLQDCGFSFDRRAYYGRSVYGDDQTIVNTQGYSARNASGAAYTDRYSEIPLGVGLHIYGSRNDVTQAADVLTRGTGAVGVRVDGTENALTIEKDAEIHADGKRGVGVLVSYGRNQSLHQRGTVTAAGTGGVGLRFDFGSNSLGASGVFRGSYISYVRGVADGKIEARQRKNVSFTDPQQNVYYAPELGGPLVAAYELSGRLVGAENAVYIGKNAFVKEINIREGASIEGNITSDWKHFHTDGSYDEDTYTEEGTDWSEGPPPDITVTAPGLRIQYGGKTGNDGYDYSRYIPDLVTALNFDANIAYNGNISGSDNIRLNVAGGSLTYGGQADVVSVSVAEGASLLGGSFKLNDMTSRMADGFSDSDAGRFVNHGVIGAASADTTQTVSGRLVSDGTLVAYGGGNKGWIEVSDAADIDGSTVTAVNAMPNETWTALKAGTVSGAVANPGSAPYAATGMLNTAGAVDGNTLVARATASNNLGTSDAVVNEAYEAMVRMHDSLSAASDPRVHEMRPLFNLRAEDAKAALSSLSSNAAAECMALAQTNTLTGHIVSSRLAEAFATKPADVRIPVAQLADGEKETAIELSMKLPQPADNDFWFKAAKNWGSLKGGANYHGTSFAVGWDRAYSRTWRAGAFVSYGTVGFADDSARNELKDTRFGLYGGYQVGPHAGYVYLDYGWLKNDLSRSIARLGLTSAADYDSRILELGGEYAYDLQAGKDTPWHISPYANLQLSTLWQDEYTERDAGVFGQRVDSASNTYFAGGLGFEFKRRLANGSCALRLGAKHAFTGADPKLTFGYVGDPAANYEMKHEQDKTHFVMSISGEAEFAPGWKLSGDAVLQKGAHDKDVLCALTLRRLW